MQEIEPIFEVVPAKHLVHELEPILE